MILTIGLGFILVGAQSWTRGGTWALAPVGAVMVGVVLVRVFNALLRSLSRRNRHTGMR